MTDPVTSPQPGPSTSRPRRYNTQETLDVIYSDLDLEVDLDDIYPESDLESVDDEEDDAADRSTPTPDAGDGGRRPPIDLPSTSAGDHGDGIDQDPAVDMDTLTDDVRPVPVQPPPLAPLQPQPQHQDWTSEGLDQGWTDQFEPPTVDLAFDEELSGPRGFDGNGDDFLSGMLKLIALTIRFHDYRHRNSSLLHVFL